MCVCCALPRHALGTRIWKSILCFVPLPCAHITYHLSESAINSYEFLYNLHTTTGAIVFHVFQIKRNTQALCLCNRVVSSSVCFHVRVHLQYHFLTTHTHNITHPLDFATTLAALYNVTANPHLCDVHYIIFYACCACCALCAMLFIILQAT